MEFIKEFIPFDKTDKLTIEDAKKLSMQEFVLKYKKLTGEEQLSKHYMELRSANEEPEAVDIGTVEKQKKIFSKPLSKGTIKLNLSDESIEIDPWKEGEGGLHADGTEMELEEDINPDEIVKRTNPGRVIIDKRDTRIKELLLANTKTADIISIMANEGIKVHAPQVSAVRNTIK